MTMKLLKVHVAVTTLVSCVDAMVSVSAVTSNSLIARQDSLSLLELFRRHPAPFSEHDVGPMLKSAESALMNLATSHRSAPLADLVAQIRPFITQMQDSIRVAHTTAQQTLTDLKNDIDGCNTIKTTGEAEASALEAAKTTYSTNHKSCRTAEKTAGNELDGCTETLDALEGAKSSSCQLHEDAKQTPGCGGIPANSGESWESYTERAADYFAQERDDFKHKKTVCLNDTAKLEDKKKKCLGSDATLKKTYDDTKLQCNGYQSQLESSTCSYVSRVNSTCHSFAACANTLADSFDAQNAGDRTLEQQRKVEWNATERLLCLLDVYGGGGDVDATKLQTCQHMADNTSHLNILYPIAPQRPDPCQELLPHPCEADYTSQEYGALDAPALQCTPCAFASSANGGWTLVLRQTMPFLYQVNQWSLNPTDPSNDNYAILDRLEDFRVDGKFEFKLVWPADGLQEQHWKQTNNFVTRRQTGVTGYEAISTPYTDQYWGGLEYNNQVALADGSVSNGNWFYAVGATHIHSGGIPMDHATKESASQTELWVKGPGSSPPPPASCSRQARYWKLTVTAGGTYGTGPDVDGHYCFGGYGPYGFAIYDGSSNRILPSAVECTECRGSYGDSALLGSFTNGQHWCVWSPQNNGRSVLTITFAQDVTPAEYKFDCGGASNCATSWTIEQSMDGTSWTEIETQTNRPPNNPQEYVLEPCSGGAVPLSSSTVPLSSSTAEEIAQAIGVAADSMHNVARESGAVIFSSGSQHCSSSGPQQGTGIHCFQNVFDGVLGNSNSWIPNAANGFVGVRLLQPTQVYGFRVSRKAPGASCCDDRIGGTYDVQYTNEPGANHDTPDEKWVSGPGQTFTRSSYGFLYFKFAQPVSASAFRMVVSDRDACIDEWEIYGKAPAVEWVQQTSTQCGSTHAENTAAEAAIGRNNMHSPGRTENSHLKDYGGQSKTLAQCQADCLANSLCRGIEVGSNSADPSQSSSCCLMYSGTSGGSWSGSCWYIKKNGKVWKYE